LCADVVAIKTANGGPLRSADSAAERTAFHPTVFVSNCEAHRESVSATLHAAQRVADVQAQCSAFGATLGGAFFPPLVPAFVSTKRSTEYTTICCSVQPTVAATNDAALIIAELATEWAALRTAQCQPNSATVQPADFCAQHTAHGGPYNSTFGAAFCAALVSAQCTADGATDKRTHDCTDNETFPAAQCSAFISAFVNAVHAAFQHSDFPAVRCSLRSTELTAHCAAVYPSKRTTFGSADKCAHDATF